MTPRRSRGAWLADGRLWIGGAVFVAGLAGAVVLRQMARTPGRLDTLRNALDSASRPGREWVVVKGLHWQLKSSEGEPTAVTDAAEGNRGSCPAGMAYVAGAFLSEPAGGVVERMQDEVCTRWIDRDYPARCAVFDRDKWLASSHTLGRTPLRFCIDRFEYPNVRGENPIVVVTFKEARTLCSETGKRLCSEAEWTFACEGEEGAPYPYGYERDADACIVDRPWRPWNESAYARRSGETVRAELERLWQGEPSGSRPRCKSPFGVYDMTGNVDEWTRSVRSEGLPSILKGGYWGPIRGRCRPSTRAHGETFVAYQQGFRCCSDAPAGEQDDAASDAGPLVEPASEP